MGQTSGLKKLRGLTLLEMIVSIAIFALIATTIAIVFKSSVTVYQSASDESTAMQKGQVALGWLTRDISLATCIYEANPASLGLKNDKWGYVRYYLSDSSLMRTDCDSDQIVAQDVTNFNINYYDSANQSTSVICDIKTIEITLSVSLEGDQVLDLYKVVAPESTCEDCSYYTLYGNGELGGHESFEQIEQTQDGGYMLGGKTSSFGAGGYDLLLVKTDSSLGIEWTKTYGASGADELHTFKQTSDGGYILGGTTRSFGAGYTDLLLAKVNSTGAFQWAKSYGYSNFDYFYYTLEQTQDGGYIVAGVIGGTSILLFKTNSLGTVQWSKLYSGTSPDKVYSLQITSDGGYILGGYTKSFGARNQDVLLMKTDANGNVGAAYPGTWAKRYGGAEYEYYGFTQQTQDGGYIIGGSGNSFETSSELFLIKTDADGNVGAAYPGTWAKTYGGAYTDTFWSLRPTSDGGYILLGYTTSFGVSNYSSFGVKVDAEGDVIWAKTYAGPSLEYLKNAHETSEGMPILIGFTMSFTPNHEAFIIQTDAQGDVECCDYCQDVTSTLVQAEQSFLVTSVTPDLVSTASPPTQSGTFTVTEPTLTTTLLCPAASVSP